MAVAVPAFLHAHGILPVIAPITSTTHQLWTSGHGFSWILYPFLDSHTGYEVALSDTQWIALGQSLKAVHATVLPPTIDQRLPREDYSSQWCDIVKELDQQLETRTYDDPVAGHLAAFWMTNDQGYAPWFNGPTSLVERCNSEPSTLCCVMQTCIPEMSCWAQATS